MRISKRRLEETRKGSSPGNWNGNGSSAMKQKRSGYIMKPAGNMEAYLQTESNLLSLAKSRVVVEPALPQRPVGPRKLFNTALAGILGLFAGVMPAKFFVGMGYPGEGAATIWAECK